MEHLFWHSFLVTDRKQDITHRAQFYDKRGQFWAERDIFEKSAGFT